MPAGVPRFLRMAATARAAPNMAAPEAGAAPPVVTAVQVQAELEVGSPDDTLEREADRVAEAAVAPPGPAAPPYPGCRCAAGCACSGPAVRGGQTGLERAVTAAPARVQRAPGRSTGAEPTLPARLLESGVGRPLDAPVRARMEARLGHDFGAVRVHDGGGAAAAEHIGAKAFTYRNDIYFGRGRYQPHTSTGQRLIAHELTHTLQQAGAAAPAVQRDPVEPAAAPVDHAAAEDDAREVYAALSGWNDEPRAIRALAGHDRPRREAIQAAFQRQRGWSLRGYLRDQLSGLRLVQAYALLRSHHSLDPHTAMAAALIPLGTRDDEIFRLLHGTSLEGRQLLEREYNLTFGELGNGSLKIGNGSLKDDLGDDLSGWRKQKALALLDRNLTEADELYFDSVGIAGTHDQAVIALLQRVWDRGPAAMMEIELDWNRYVRNDPPWTDETWSSLSLYDAMASELSLEAWRLVRAVLVGHMAYRDRVGVAAGPLGEEQARSDETIRLEVAEATLRAASEGGGTNEEQVNRAVRQIREIYTARIQRAEAAHDERLLREARAAWEERRQRLVDVDIPGEMDAGTTEHQQARLLTQGELGPADEIYLASREDSNDATAAAVMRVWAQGRIDAYLAAAARARTDDRGEILRPAFNPLLVVPVSSGLPFRRVATLSREGQSDASRGSARLAVELGEGSGEGELALAHALLTTSGMRPGLRDEVVARYVEAQLGSQPGNGAPHRFLSYVEARYGRVHSFFQLQELLDPARTAAAAAERAQGRYNAAHSGILNRVLTDLTLSYDVLSGEHTEAVALESLARLRYIAAHSRTTAGELDAMMAIMRAADADALARVEYGLFQQRLEELQSVRRAVTETVVTAVQLAIETVATILTAGAAGPALLASMAATLAAIALREALLGDDYEALSRESAQAIALVFASHGFGALGRSLAPLSQEMSRARMFLATAAQEGVTQVGTQTVHAVFEGRVPTAEGIALAAMSVIGHGAAAGARGAITHTPGASSPTGVRADIVHNLGGDVSAARRLRTAVVGHLAQNAISATVSEAADLVTRNADLSGGDLGVRFARAAAGVMARGVLGGLGEFGAHARATARDRRAADEEAMHNPAGQLHEGTVVPRAATEPGLVAVARVNHAHTVSLVRLPSGEILVTICSPHCGQLIGLLKDLRTRTQPANYFEIDARVADVRALQQRYGQNEPVDPVGAQALANLAAQVEALRARVGETQMFQGVAGIPVVPNPQDPDFHFCDPSEVAIASLALPPGVGIRGPRDFRRNARDVTDRILGPSLNIAAAIRGVPSVPFDPNRDPPLTGRLYSHYHNGSGKAPVYLTHLRVGAGGAPKLVAVKLYPSFGSYQHAEVLHGQILGELGVGPHVFGVVTIRDRTDQERTGLVMEAVTGDFAPEVMAVGSRAVQDLQTAVQRMRAAGIAIGDFQYFVTPEGRAVIIDSGGAGNYTDPNYGNWQAYMDSDVATLQTTWNNP
ncbi:eCIS core domain-containing protein [Sorangium sp. So ce1389]|uniref:eCIS core domain-containing protein n=1 Tax=Sorangium sp. So ce1389 TaxID=3133336 RepID=UPI003F617E09